MTIEETRAPNYVEKGIQQLFGPRFRRVEGNWYRINDHRMIRVCYSKTFDRVGFKRYWFGIQQKKYEQYKSQDIHILFVCGDFDKALLIPRIFLDDLIEGVPTARDGSWKFDIHQREHHFEILVTGKNHRDISVYLCRVLDDPIFQPTSNSILLNERVKRIRECGKIARPKGSQKPKAVSRSMGQVFERLPAVKAWILQEAKGICELCNQLGPFVLSSGERYLEVHHVKQLADGGPDIVENAVALCPNCHRLLHWAVDALEAKEKLYKQVTRLTKV